jgi:hypothetical protein
VSDNMPMVATDARETNQVLAGGADGIDAALSLQSLFDGIFGLPGILTYNEFVDGLNYCRFKPAGSNGD